VIGKVAAKSFWYQKTKVGKCRKGQATNERALRKREACNAQSAMNVYAPRRNQGSLRDQQENPAGKHRAVHMNNRTGLRRPEDSGKVVAGRRCAYSGAVINRTLENRMSGILGSTLL
jgi:hypothetical protein